MNKKAQESVARMSYEDREKMYSDSRNKAAMKAMEAEKVRYKSNNSPSRFLTFLKDRLDILDSRKTSVVEKGFLKKGFTKRYNERLYDKTKKIIESLEA
jgi:Cft2 family RNA processing exonuclease